MKKLKILRRRQGEAKGRWQSFFYEPESDNDTVATALKCLNDREELTDASGAPAEKIEWECSCLQKKCGACAMVINGRPQLACGARLLELPDGIDIEPLKKFPVICDLLVDRSILYENLKTLKLWFMKDAEGTDSRRDLSYEASGCLQCGCCLEICPNFYAGGSFFGMATVPLTARLLSNLNPKDRKEIAKLYSVHTFSGCGKSLACMDICPKKIDTERLLVNANALAIWKRRL